MIIRTAKIFVKLEADVSEQIPLIGLSLSCKGEVTNWTSKVSEIFLINLFSRIKKYYKNKLPFSLE